ncbi:MAG: DNA/RNA helicase domain-containing protein, partial [Enhydrobacter sp.]
MIIALSPVFISSFAELNEIALKARNGIERHLVLVTGVPGAGKTLLGLQFVYNDHFEQGHESKGAVMLSGNGPLVKVLQHALKSRVFIGDVHGFLKQYGGETQNKPKERIFVY